MGERWTITKNSGFSLNAPYLFTRFATGYAASLAAFLVLGNSVPASFWRAASLRRPTDRPDYFGSLLHGAPPFQACGGMIAHTSGQFSSVRRTWPAPGAQPQSASNPAPGEFRQVLVAARMNACCAPNIRGSGNAADGLFRSWRPRKVDAQIEKPPQGWLRASALLLRLSCVVIGKFKASRSDAGPGTVASSGYRWRGAHITISGRLYFNCRPPLYIKTLSVNMYIKKNLHCYEHCYRARHSPLRQCRRPKAPQGRPSHEHVTMRDIYRLAIRYAYV